MAKKNDHLADFATENTGGMLTGFLADEEHLDRRAMLRLGTWGAASVGAIIVALLANQSSLRLRHDELAAADLSRQAQQIQSIARESQNETRRLASAIDTLNSDRDRTFTRLSTLEQGLDSVTGAIARQSSATPPPAPAASTTSAAPTAAAPASAAPSAPQPAAEAAAPAPEAAATETAPLIGPVATMAVVTGKQAAEAKRREQANAKMAAATLPPIPTPAPAVPAPSNPPATTASIPPLGAAKSMMGPPDPAAPKLIEPEPAKTATATASPVTPQATTAPAPQLATATAAPESATATPSIDKDKPATDKPATAETAPEASPQLAVNRTEFGVDVGGANSVGGLRALWRGLLKSRSNAPLAALQPIIVIKESNSGLGMQLRLVAGPLTDAAAAAKICATMVENERPCATTVYDGQHLAMKVDDAPASTGAISPKTSSERSSEPEAEKRVAEKPAAPKSGSSRQTWRRHSYQKRTAVEEPPAEKPKSTTASTISSFFHRSN